MDGEQQGSLSRLQHRGQGRPTCGMPGLPAACGRGGGRSGKEILQHYRGDSQSTKLRHYKLR